MGVWSSLTTAAAVATAYAAVAASAAPHSTSSRFAAPHSVSLEPVFPAPFSRPLHHVPGQPWQANGSDVVVAQHLLRRSPFARPTAPCCSGVYDADTAAVVAAVQAGAGIKPADAPGALDVATAAHLLAHHSYDGYVDDGRSARSQGYLFKVLVPVHANRSIETTAHLLGPDNAVLLSFPVRAHGHDVLPDGRPDARPWPDYDSDDAGLNVFSSGGATPTGLSQADLNSPEDDPRLYGPYPIVRVVQGVSGNAGFLLPFIRNGILLHTGEWPSVDPTMPNSAGCIHTHPESLKSVGELLQTSCGAKVRNNTNGQLPYPYQPQGLISVFQVD